MEKLNKSEPGLKLYIEEVFWLLNSYFLTFKVAKSNLFETKRLGKK